MKRTILNKVENYPFSIEDDTHMHRLLRLLKEREIRLSLNEGHISGSTNRHSAMQSKKQIIKILNHEIELRLKLYE